MTDIPPFRPVDGFGSLLNGDTGSSDESPLLQWYCAPDSWASGSSDNNDEAAAKKEGKGGWCKIEGSQLKIGAPAKKDFWRKTYYEPLLIKDDGPFLHTVVHTSHFPIMITTKFTIQAKRQFDQVGILLRLDHEHWLKTGIEVVDGVPRVSCVTTNGFSDWSTQTWTSTSVCIRVHCISQNGGSYVVEMAPYPDDDDQNWDRLDWSMMRVCHMNRDMNHNLLNDHETVKNAFQGPAAPDDCIMVGLFAACPEDQQGTVATFDGLNIVQGSTFEHNADVLQDP